MRVSIDRNNERLNEVPCGQAVSANDNVGSSTVPVSKDAVAAAGVVEVAGSPKRQAFRRRSRPRPYRKAGYRFDQFTKIRWEQMGLQADILFWYASLGKTSV